MGRKIFFTIVILFIIIFFIYSKIQKDSDNVYIISWCVADIDNDNIDELLVINNRNGEGVIEETGEPHGSNLEIYKEFSIINDYPKINSDPVNSFDLFDIKPFYVQAGDVTGDGVIEISICVYKTTKFHDVMAKRPFFYDLINDELEPVWLGSRLSRPFIDYRLLDIDNDNIDEIISLEKTQDGKTVICTYDWEDFGFVLKSISDEEFEGGISFIDDNIYSEREIILNQTLEDDTKKLKINFDDTNILISENN